MNIKKGAIVSISILSIIVLLSLIIFTNSNVASATCQFSTTLRLGSTGASVINLQTWLINNGYPIASIVSGMNQKGYFGYETYSALAKYQRVVSLAVTGALDTTTMNKINSTGDCSSNSSSYSSSPSPTYSPLSTYSPSPTYTANTNTDATPNTPIPAVLLQDGTDLGSPSNNNPLYKIPRDKLDQREFQIMGLLMSAEPNFAFPGRWMNENGGYMNNVQISQITNNTLGDLPVTVVCRNPVSLARAQVFNNILTAHGINADQIINNSTRYVALNINALSDAIDNRLGFMSDGSPYVSSFPMHLYPVPTWGYCLDAGYVSNYPTYMRNFTAFVNSHSNPPSRIVQFGEQFNSN